MQYCTVQGIIAWSKGIIARSKGIIARLKGIIARCLFCDVNYRNQRLNKQKLIKRFRADWAYNKTNIACLISLDIGFINSRRLIFNSAARR